MTTADDRPFKLVEELPTPWPRCRELSVFRFSFQKMIVSPRSRDCEPDGRIPCLGFSLFKLELFVVRVAGFLLFLV